MIHNRISSFIPVLLLAICTLALAYPNTASSQNVSSMVAYFTPLDTAQISAKLVDGTSVEIAIKRTKFTTNSFPYTTSHHPRILWAGWGAMIEHPSTVITAISVKAGGNDIQVSMSSFSDLGNPKRVIFEDLSIGYEDAGYHLVDKTAFRLIVFGGETATAYIAELHFNTSILERRIVWLVEFPIESREETIYGIRP